jgi:Spy/CpxP family protein refolding chaperone
MKHQLTKTMGLAMVGAALLVAAPVFASSHNSSASEGVSWHSHDRGSIIDLLQKRAKEFNLTADQKDKIKALRATNETERKAFWAEMKKDRQEMRQLIQSKDYTEDKAKEMIAAKSEARQKMMLMRANTAHQVWLVLTPEQQQKVQAMMEKREAKVKAIMEKHSKS